MVMSVPRKSGTIPMTCSLDGRAHNVTDNSLRAGQRTGRYQALCGHLVSAAALAAPLGRPCTKCLAAILMADQAPTTLTARCWRHRQPGWLRRILQPRRTTGAHVTTG